MVATEREAAGAGSGDRACGAVITAGTGILPVCALDTCDNRITVASLAHRPVRRFCSDACRAMWHKKRRDAETKRLREELATLQASLPFSGRSPQARQCSHDAAVSAAPARGAKTARYLEWLALNGPATDHAAAAHFGWPLSTINSIRNGAMNHGRHIEPDGTALSPYGKEATRWRLL